LYFIAGPVPTEAEREDAEQFYNGKSTVAFRNARFVNKDEAIEAFDIVAGLVPANYAAAALEKGEDALQAVAGRRRRHSARRKPPSGQGRRQGRGQRLSRPLASPARLEAQRLVRHNERNRSNA
jgi:hypothetical protein